MTERYLIKELQAELDRSCRVRGGGDAAASGGVDRRVRQIEVHRVEKVERLSPELELLRAVYPETLEQGEVDVPLVVSTEDAAIGVSVVEVGGHDERSRVEPLLERRIVELARPDLVRPLAT